MVNNIARHILVVDDQENWRVLLTSLLADEGYIVEVAASFEEAKHKIVCGIFAVIILDVRLVDKETFNIQGIELLETVKSQENAPGVIIITGYPDDIPEEHLYQADALLLKVPPGATFSSSEFIEKVTKLIGQAIVEDA